DGVGGVLDQAQVGEQVLDLAPLPEADAADQAVGDAAAAEDVLEGAGLGVDAVEDGEVAVAAPLDAAEALDLVGHEPGLPALVVELGGADPLPADALGPEPLGRA